MKHYKVVKEDPHHFVMHDSRDNTQFKVAKKGLSTEMLASVVKMPKLSMETSAPLQKLADGGPVKKPTPAPSPLDPAKAKSAQDSMRKAFGYSEGGDVPTAEERNKQVADRYKETHPQSNALENAAFLNEQAKHREEDKGPLVVIPKYSEGGDVEDNKAITKADLSRFAAELRRLPQSGPGKYIKPPNAQPNMGDVQLDEDVVHKNKYSEGGQVMHPTHEKMVDIFHKLTHPEKYDAAVAGPPSITGAPNMGTDAGVTAAQMRVVNPGKGYAEGGAIEEPAPLLPMSTGDELPFGGEGPRDMMGQPDMRPEIPFGGPGPQLITGAPDTEAIQKAKEQLAAEQAVAEHKKRIDELTSFDFDNKAKADAGVEPSPPPIAPTNVPPEQQISLKPAAPAPREEIPTAQPGSDFASQYKTGAGREIAGIQAAAKATGEASAETATQQAQANKANAEREQNYQADYKKRLQKLDTLAESVAKGDINPNRVWENKDTGSKIATALGMLFSGLGSGLSGQPNMAYEYLQKAISNDIDAQKTDKTNKMNMYRAGLEELRDGDAAHKNAMVNANAILAGQISQIASKYGTAQAAALAQQLTGKIMAESGPKLQDISLKAIDLKQKQLDLQIQQDALKTLGTQEGSAPARGVDSNKLRALIRANLIPKGEQAQAMKEYGEYMKLDKELGKIDRDYKELQDTATYTGRFLGEHGPTFRESTKQYDQLANRFLEKFTKDISGRVTPENVSLIRHSLPVRGDSPETAAKKKEGVKDVARSKHSFPTLQTYKLLSEDDSTMTGEPKFKEGKPVIE